jgi:hypothetical protein
MRYNVSYSMASIKKPIQLHWTQHAKMKMGFYRLSPGRVRRVLHSPRRTEEGVAEKTIAMMQPASMKRTAVGKESWGQEIWVMFQDSPKVRTVISAWRYPGMTKPRGEIAMGLIEREYGEFVTSGKE